MSRAQMRENGSDQPLTTSEARDTLVYTVEGPRVGRCRRCLDTDWITNLDRDGCEGCGYTGPESSLLADLPCVTYFYTRTVQNSDGEDEEYPDREHEVFMFRTEAEREVWVAAVLDAYPNVELVLSKTSSAERLLESIRIDSEGQEPLGGEGCV